MKFNVIYGTLVQKTGGGLLEEKVELLCKMLWPYVRELVSQVLSGEANLNEATVESLVEPVCFRAELTVRSMVKELNEKARRGELEELQKLIREDPELAREASKYVATRLKRQIRKLILSELSEKGGVSQQACGQLKNVQNSG